jgi:hypothetical protein
VFAGGAGRKKEVVMVDVPLSTQEIELIRFVIERYRKAMLFEIANTDSRELRHHLQEREDTFEALVQKLDSFAGQPDTLEQ